MVFCSFTATLMANTFSEYTSKLINIDGEYASIEDSDAIFVGSSGVVIHSFDASTSSIIARVDVVEKKGGLAKLRFDVYTGSAQSAFPIPGVVPQIGDTVKLNYLYSRALIVAPTQSIYKEITEHFDDIQWIHPDIMATYLARKFKPNPDREDFQATCKDNAAALIFFALESHGYFVDCNNFKIIKSYKGSSWQNVQVPFYSRVSDIESSWLRWGSTQINDYHTHYNALIQR